MNDQATGSVVATLPPTDDAISRIAKAGTAAIAQYREVTRIRDQIAGMTWGSGTYAVQGSSLSPQTQAAFAEFCAVTRANPLIHIDVLGGKPYLNSSYWSDLVNREDAFIRDHQRDISPHVEEALRVGAENLRQIAEKMTDEGEKARLMAKAFEREEEAVDLAVARAQWGAPDYATHIVETTITRFINVAPIEKVRAGELSPSELAEWTKTRTECNWAGGMGDRFKSNKKFDPVGDMFPALTARTRSFRRAACKSFSAWGAEYEHRIERAQEVLVAEWEIIREDADLMEAALPGVGEPQAARLGSGEPQAASAKGAKPLPPVDDSSPSAPEAESEAAPEGYDVKDYRKRLFATLRDFGITNDPDRKTWAAKNDLPESTKKWKKEDWERALELLVAPAREQFRAGCIALGLDPVEFSNSVLGYEPTYLKHYNELNQILKDRADREAVGEG